MPAPDCKSYDNWTPLFLIWCWIDCILRYLANLQSQYILERVVGIKQIEMNNTQKNNSELITHTVVINIYIKICNTQVFLSY